MDHGGRGKERVITWIRWNLTGLRVFRSPAARRFGIADFGLNTSGQELDLEGEYEVVIDASTKGIRDWRELLRFTLVVRLSPEHRHRYIAYSNDPDYYVLVEGADDQIVGER